ncbi:MAG: MopE-related protein [Pseudomonadota bacterium]
MATVNPRRVSPRSGALPSTTSPGTTPSISGRVTTPGSPLLSGPAAGTFDRLQTERRQQLQAAASADFNTRAARLAEVQRRREALERTAASDARIARILADRNDQDRIPNRYRDCDDTKTNVNPAVPEVCDGVDDNCDGAVDEGVTIHVYEDRDGDGFGSDARRLDICLVGTAPAGVALRGGDCDDNDSSRTPINGCN